MEWVETTGRTLEEAKDAALDQLGVDESDAEFEVVEQPRAGLFGRMRGEARVRARVRPTAPRAKEDRRDRRRRGKGAGGTGAAQQTTVGPATEAGGPVTTAPPGTGVGAGSIGAPPEANLEPAETKPGGGGNTDRESESPDDVGASAGPGRPRRRRRRGASRGPDTTAGTPSVDSGASKAARARNDGPEPAGGGRDTRRRFVDPESEYDQRREGNDVEVPLQEQARVAEDFLSGLVGEFGLQAQLSVNERDDDNLDLALSGHDLGLLIGQKGATLLAVQDLTRTVVQHKTSATNGRIHVDVGGYRQKRSEALAKFALEVAAQVKQSGQRAALEPMSAADRKVVHDTITEVEGVNTVSEGEDPRRRVVIIPAEQAAV